MRIATPKKPLRNSEKSQRLKRGKKSSSRAPAVQLMSSSVFGVFTESFEDGLAIFGPDDRLVYFNQPYMRLMRGIDDALCVGVSHDEILAVGIHRGVWDLQGLECSQWKKQYALQPGVRSSESYPRFADGRWILRRNTRNDSGYIVELCSDLSRWKQREDELNSALQRAELAERTSRLALISEETRKSEEALLSRLNHWLHSCKRMEELHEVVLAFFARLMPGSRGTLYVYNNSRDVLVPTCSWNNDKATIEIKPDDCWGLRQGRAYHHGHDGWSFTCDHKRSAVAALDGTQYFCIPILAHGDTAGMLHVVPQVEIVADTEKLKWAFKIACKCAEQISLAIANVKLGQELKDQSTHDSLTNLFNRRYFLERCSREIARSTQTGLPSTIISLDVDHFKKFNDNFGHDAGDVVLKNFARELLAHFRGDDIVCRLGGEEFCVLLPGAPRRIGIERATTLLPKIQAMQVRYGNETLPPVTVSAGVITVPESGDSVQLALQSADRAVYEAKARGRNCVVSFEGLLESSVHHSAQSADDRSNAIVARCNGTH